MSVRISSSGMRRMIKTRSHSRMMTSTMRLKFVGETGPPWVTSRPARNRSPKHPAALQTRTPLSQNVLISRRALGLLDNDKFRPGNRPYWETKEGRVSIRYPGLLQALSKVQDPGKRKLLFESHRRKMGGIIGNPTRRLEWQEIGISRQ